MSVELTGVDSAPSARERVSDYAARSLIVVDRRDALSPELRAGRAAESGDRYEIDPLEEPDDEPADWHLDDPVRLPEDIGPTREQLDAEFEFNAKENEKLLRETTAAIVNAIAILDNDLFATRVAGARSTLEAALDELADFMPEGGQ
jgi:hypothetical protein